MVVRRRDADKPWVRERAAASQASDVKKVIEKRFEGAMLAGWQRRTAGRMLKGQAFEVDGLA